MTMMKKLSSAVLLATAAALVLPAAADEYYVAVSQIVDHPALDANRDGIKLGLEHAGYVEGKNLRFVSRSAQGNPAIATQIAKQFVGESPDVLVGIATPTAQALAAATDDIPIVFSAVTDPVGAKLLDSMDAPGGNVTGLSDLSPVGQHVEIMAEIVPGLQTIGVVYNSAEANAVSLVDLLKSEASARGYAVREAVATRTAEVATSTQAISGESDIIYALTDNTVASAIASLVNAANQTNTPVFAAESSFVDKGAVAGVGFDYFQIGYQAAEYVVKILEGAKPSDLPARVGLGTNVVINPPAAARLGVTLPASLLENPTRTIEN